MLTNLFGVPLKQRGRKSGGSRPRTAKVEVLGCEGCPLDKVPGVRKIKRLEQVTGRTAMLWAQSPGATENELGKELMGKAGTFLWEELAKVGLTRNMFDIQNVIRCRPIDRNGTEHPPTKQELKCCSIYNDEALRRNANHARVHLIFGKPAGISLLGRNYRKDRPIFWHEPWNAYVVLIDHPSYLLRIGGRNAGWAYYTFRDRLRAAATCLRYPGRWGYVHAQDYAGISTETGFNTLEKQLYVEAKAGRRVSVDIEDGVVDGVKRLLLVGFAWGEYDKPKGMGEFKGAARSVVLWHPENKQPPEVIERLQLRLKKVLEDPVIKKCMQHGSYDVKTTYEISGIHIQGYDFDTQYALYLKHTQLRSYSLESIIRFFLQEFQDYKEMGKGFSNFADIPLKQLITYNCADSDVTKRAELKSKDSISQALLYVYIHVAKVLDAMEERGPYLDWESHRRLDEAVNEKLEAAVLDIQEVAGDPEFNPGSPQQVAALLYDTLKLPVLDKDGKRTTDKDTLTTLTLRTKHPFPQLLNDWRKLNKIKTTYITGFAKSAELHNGELRTVWWLTGAVTGRLRSGKGDKAEAEGVINFQNLHGNPLLKNLLVSDLNWRIAL